MSLPASVFICLLTNQWTDVDGSFPGCPLNWAYPENFSKKFSRLHPDQMSEKPLLAALDVEEHQLYHKSLLEC